MAGRGRSLSALPASASFSLVVAEAVAEVTRKRQAPPFLVVVVEAGAVVTKSSFRPVNSDRPNPIQLVLLATVETRARALAEATGPLAATLHSVAGR